MRGVMRDSGKVELLTKKWDGRPHRLGEVDLLGEDQFGTWLWGRAGRTIAVGTDGSFITEQNAVFLVPVQSWWAPAWWIGHPEVSIYVDICTPAVRQGSRVEWIDLDLDVVRYVDGSAQIVDQDEFEAHQVALEYPSEVITAATLAAETVLGMIEREDPPFDGRTVEDWIARGRSIALR
jgi:uncharacterized protein